MLNPIPGFITIHFVKSETNDDDDDFITIRPIATNQVSLVMTGHTKSTRSATQAVLHLSHDDCLRWLVRTTNLLSTDDYPIKRVQFDFPLCPSVMYDLATLDGHINVIYDMLSFQLSLWNSRPELNDLPRPVPIEIPQSPHLEAYDSDELNTAFIEEGEAAGRHSQQKGRHHLFFDDLA